MKFTQLDIEGVWLVEPVRHGDDRGYFMETWRADEFEQAVGRPYRWVQENESFSGAGVLRGLHLQRGEWSQAKLVRVSRGRVVDVAVDLRPGSATFGKHVAVELSAENARQLLVPRGFAHGFYVIEGPAQFQYKVDNAYRPDMEATLLFNDPALAIAWPIPEGTQPNLSAKDLKGSPLSELETGF